jgi:hypothetical protein
MSTTNADSYTADKLHLTKSKATGKRRELIEAALLERAIAASVAAEEEFSAKDWISTHHEDFDHTNLYPDMCDLGLFSPINSVLGDIVLSQEEKDKYENPITFFSEESKTGSGTVVCSLPSSILQSGRGFGQDGKPLKLVFGRRLEFSTPINQSMNPHPPK